MLLLIYYKSFRRALQLGGLANFSRSFSSNKPLTNDNKIDILTSMSAYSYEIVPLAIPKLIRNNKSYICTEKFRINSHKKVSDVWLIYKSEKGSVTWNMTILTRVSNLAIKIGREQYENFLMNDEKTVWKYAFDPQLVKSCGASFDTSLDYKISGPDIEQILSTKVEEIQLSIFSEYFIPINIKSVLSSVLKKSGKEVEFLSEAGCLSSDARLTRNMGKGFSINMNLKKLTQYSNFNYRPCHN